MARKRYTTEELTCPECAAEGIAWVARNANGLRGHRMFKHGVLPSKQLELFEQREPQQQDRLVSVSMLEERIDALELKLGLEYEDSAKVRFTDPEKYEQRQQEKREKEGAYPALMRLLKRNTIPDIIGRLEALERRMAALEKGGKAA